MQEIKTKCLKETKTLQKIDFVIELKRATLLCFKTIAMYLVFVAFWSEEKVLWTMDPSFTYFCHVIDPTHGGFCWKYDHLWEAMITYPFKRSNQN